MFDVILLQTLIFDFLIHKMELQSLFSILAIDCFIIDFPILKLIFILGYIKLVLHHLPLYANNNFSNLFKLVYAKI